MSKAVSRLFDQLRNDGRDQTLAESSQCSFSLETTGQGLHNFLVADKFMKKSSQKPIHNKQLVELDPPDDDDTRQVQTCGGEGGHFQEGNGGSSCQEHLQRSKNHLSDGNDVVMEQPIPRLQRHASSGIKCLDKLRKSQASKYHINHSASEEGSSSVVNRNNTLNHGGQFITPDPHNNNFQEHPNLQSNLGTGQNKKILSSSRGNNDGYKQNSTLTANQQNKRKRGRPRKNDRPPSPERTPTQLKRTASTRGGGSFVQQQPKASPKLTGSDHQGQDSVARYGGDRNASQMETDHRIVNRDNTKMASTPPSSSLSSEESSEVQINGANTNQPVKMVKESTLPSTEKQTSEERVLQLHKSKEPLSKSCIISSSNESSKVSMIQANNNMVKHFQQPAIASNMSSPLLSITQAPKLPQAATPLMPVQPPPSTKKTPRQLTVIQRRKMTNPTSQRRRGGVSSSSSSSRWSSEDDDGAGQEAAAALKEPKPLIQNEQSEYSSDEESKGDDGLSHQQRHQVLHDEQLSLQGPHQIFQFSNPPVNQGQTQLLHQMSGDSLSFPNNKQIGVQQQLPHASATFQRNPIRSSLSIGRGDNFLNDNMSPSRLSQFDIHKEPDINGSLEQNHGGLYDFDQEPNRRMYPSHSVEIGDTQQGHIQRMPSSSSLLNYGIYGGSFLNLNGSSHQLRPPTLNNLHSSLRIGGHEPMGFSFQSQHQSSLNISPRPRVQSDLSRGGGIVGDPQFHHQQSSTSLQQQTMFNFDISSHHLFQNEGLYGSHSGPSHISHMLGDTLVSPRHYQHQNRPSRPL